MSDQFPESGTGKSGIGARVLRNEDTRHLAGRGQFLADLRIEGMLEVAFLRSPVAHARIDGIHADGSGIGGDVFTADDLAWVRPIVAAPPSPDFRVSAQHPLAVDKVRFVGEAIAMCVSHSRADAEDLASQIQLNLTDLVPTISIDNALLQPQPSLIHEDWPDNFFMSQVLNFGDVDSISQTAEVSITRTYRMNRQAGVPMEGRGVLAYRDHRLDELVVFSSTQFPHVIRTGLAECLGLPERRIRVVAPDVGGGFGIKNILQPEEVAVAALAWILDKPLRWIEDRREHFLSSSHARDHRYRVDAYADNCGRILAIDAEIVVDSGAYSVWPWTSAMEAGMAAGILPGPYDIRHYRVRTHTVATNKPPLGPYRGVARPGACFAIERTIDEIAHLVGREAYVVRSENMIRSEDMPYVSVTGKVYDSGDYALSVEKAVDMVDLPAVRAIQNATSEVLIGVGFASVTEQTSHGTDEWLSRGLPIIFGYESARGHLTPDGDLVFEVAIQSHGQGLETTLAQIASEELGVDPALVVIRHGDSSLSPYGMGTFASRSMVMAGGAVSRVCELLRDKILDVGARLLEIDPTQAFIGEARVSATDGRSVDFAAIGRAAYLRPELLGIGIDPGLEATTTYQPAVGTGAFTYATHAAVVSVDPGSGLVSILDYVVVEDCGTIVNPMIVEGQVYGGVAQGIGNALFEEIPYDDQGQPKASTFMDYLLPGATEVPRIRIHHLITPSPHTTYGIKGMGEGPAIPPPAAIANAVTDALRSRFHRGGMFETPMTPDRVLIAIESARQEIEVLNMATVRQS